MADAKPVTATQNGSGTSRLQITASAGAKTSGSSLTLPLIVIGGGAALLLAWSTSGLFGFSDEADSVTQVHEVAKSTLEISVVEQGNLESAQNIHVKCMVEAGRGAGGGGGGSGTQIIWLFPEGEFAKKGEKLVELDQSGLRQQETEQMIMYESAREAHIAAKNTYEAAVIAVKEYEHGTYPNELQLLDSNITVAEENLRRAQQYHEFSKKMYRKGYVNKLDLEADEFAVENAQLVLDAYHTQRNALVKFTREKMLTDLSGQRDSAEAAMKGAQAKFDLEEQKLQDIRDQLEKCLMVAPQDGMVIYGDERSRYRRSETPQIEEGAFVYFRQTIIRLPDLNRMQVKAKVHESMIEQVRKGQEVGIRVDAMHDLALSGEVVSIDNQPEQGHWLNTHVREYAVYIRVDQQVKNLKPGMTAQVEIEIEKLREVLTVPVQAVVQKDDKNIYCYVANRNGTPEQRPVVLGKSNDVFIQITDGLNEGDKVILNPRSMVPQARKSTDGSEEQGEPQESPAQSNV